MYNLLFILSICKAKKIWGYIFANVNAPHVSCWCFSYVLTHTAVHTVEESKVKVPLHGITFCTKTLNYQLGFSSVFLKIWPSKQFDVTTAQTTQQKNKKKKRQKNNTHTLSWLHEIKTSYLLWREGCRLFSVLYFYLGDVKPETSSPISNVISAGV